MWNWPALLYCWINKWAIQFFWILHEKLQAKRRKNLTKKQAEIRDFCVSFWVSFWNILLTIFWTILDAPNIFIAVLEKNKKSVFFSSLHIQTPLSKLWSGLFRNSVSLWGFLSLHVLALRAKKIQLLLKLLFLKIDLALAWNV